MSTSASARIPSLPPSPGARFGQYDIVAAIGKGGMGEVYRALDTNLGRQVALKVLPADVAADPERLARFDREARALAALNHPNIAVLYGVERVDGQTALAMELVEGPTLADRISGGPIEPDEAVAIGRQIADALETAHQQGIVHRDLKPANVKVRPDGTVKVLDFGLAKAVDAASPHASSVTISPTIASPVMTQAGVLMGTAAYMSPEQARGTDADHRSDIWAFGAVLFEMLSGRRPFDGETASDTLAAVLRADIDWSVLPAGTPGHLRRLLRRCLERDRTRRLQHMGDARLELEDVAGTDQASTPIVRPSPSPLWRSLLPLAIGAVLGVLGALAASRDNDNALRPEATRFLLTEAIGVKIDELTSAALSPDGQRIVITSPSGGGRAAFLHSLRDGTTSPIPGITSTGLLRTFWSSNGEWLIFNGMDGLRRSSIDGQSRVVVPLTSFNGASSLNSTEILYSDSNQVLAVPTAGGQPRTVLDTQADSLSWGSPQALPDGRRFLTFKMHGGNQEVYLAEIGGGQPLTAIAAGTHPIFAPPNHLLAVRDGQLLRWPFDPASGKVLGDPAILIDNLRVRASNMTVPFAVSSNGVLVVFEERHAPSTSLTWFSRQGVRGRSLALSTPCRNPELSPDGTRAAVECYERNGNRDVWLYDLARDAALRFTNTPSDEADPVWSPDGTRVAFASTQIGAADVFIKGAGGAANETLLLKTEGNTPTMAWHRDGNTFAILQPGIGFAMFDPNAPGKPATFTGASNYQEPQFSPDGHFVSYASNESGRQEVFVEPWPRTGDKVQLSVGGGTDGRWSPAGGEFFYVNLDRKLMSVRVTPKGRTLQASSPVELFQTRIAGPQGTGHRFPYAVSRDGQQFLMYVEEAGTIPAITVVMNWPSLLRD